MVLLPQGGIDKKSFKKELGWKAEVEIDRDYEKVTQTVYARGLCMNVITTQVIKQEVLLTEYDYSCIDFQPLR